MRSYSDEDFIKAVKNNYSMASCLRSLGLKVTGSNYTLAKSRIKHFNIDISHWTGKAYLRGTHESNTTTKYTLDEILTENSKYLNHTSLKRRLFKAKLLTYQCSICGLADWLNKPIALQLDHINGIPDDNRLLNLRLLCPNCHSQTETFTEKQLRKPPTLCPDCGGLMGPASVRCHRCSVKHRWGCYPTFSIQNPAGIRDYRSAEPKNPKLICPLCKNPKANTSNLCKSCSSKQKLGQHSKIAWPSPEELQERLSKLNYTQLAKELGVSDNAIRKHLKNHGGSGGN